MMKVKSNQKKPDTGLRARILRILGRGCPGQVTVEYMMVIIILIVPMAMALDILFEALEVLFTKLGYIMGRPYP